MRPLPRTRHFMPLAAALLAALSCGPAAASDTPASSRAVPNKATEAQPPLAKRPVIDTLDGLRERLAQKIGPTQATDSKNLVVMQVAPHASGDMVVHAKPTTARARPRPAPMAAARGATKPGAAHDATAHWSYAGETGPQAWGTMKSDFGTCATGKRQSPIDIREGIAVELEPVEFDYRTSGFTVIDTGHTVQVNLAPGNTIQVLGRRYELLQFHFHRPSEERIGGKQFDMVAHLVHKDAEGRLAVVAVLLDRGSVQPIVQTVWNNLPLEKGEELAARVTIDPNSLLPKDRRYYTYMGSLTTPPCSEGVLWMVMQQPVPIAPEQIDIFARLYPMNARPLQDASGRLIKQSN